ncbi:MAG: hypothetical protein ACOCYT_00470 [Chloroflexota bacterium]
MPSLRVTDAKTWADAQTAFSQIIELHTYLDHRLKNGDFAKDTGGRTSTYSTAAQDELNRIRQDAETIVTFLNETPLFDRQNEAKRTHIKTPTVNASSPTPPTSLNVKEDTADTDVIEHGLEKLREQYITLLDIQGQVASPADPPTPWYRRPITWVIAAVLLVGVVFSGYNGLMNIIYDMGERALEEQRYGEAIIHFSFTYNFGNNYRGSDSRLVLSYERAISQHLNADPPEFERARDRADGYFGTRLNVNDAIEAFHDVYLAEAQFFARAEPPDWEQVATVLLDLQNTLTQDITNDLDEAERNRFAVLLDLNDQERALLIDSYYQRAVILYDDGLYAQVRALVAENALPFTWEEAPRVRRIYLDSLQQEAIVASTETPPDWVTVENRVNELIARISDEETRYIPARLVLASHHLDEAIAVIEADDTVAEATPEPAGVSAVVAIDPRWETARERIEEANAVLALEAVAARLGRRALPDHITIADYQTRRNELAGELSAENRTEQDIDNLAALVSDFGQSLLLDTYYEPAEVAFNAADYASARDLYGEVFAIKRDFREVTPRYYDAFYIPATAAFEAEDYATARQLYDGLFDIGAEDYNDTALNFRLAHYIPGAAALDAGDPMTAVDLLRTLYRLDADFNDTETLLTAGLFRLGEAAIAAENYDQAEAYLEEILAIDSDYIDLTIRLSEVYYAIATGDLEAATTPTDYDNVRNTLNKLARINPAYRDTTALLRETYYQPIRLALAPMDAAPESETCDDIREDILERIEQDADFIDYRDTRLLINETFYCEARAELNRARTAEFPQLDESGAVDEDAPQSPEEALAAAREAILALGLDSNYKDINSLVIQTYYEPAVAYFRTAYIDDSASTDERREAVVRARELLNELKDNSDLFFIYYRDAAILLSSTYYIPGHQAFEAANTTGDPEDWEAARSGLEPILALDPNFAPPPDFQPADDDPTLAELLGSEALLPARVLYLETYYRPAAAAYDAEDWATARDDFLTLLEQDIAYRDAAARYRNAFYIPAQRDFNAGNWNAARAVLRSLVSFAPDYRPTAQDPMASILLRETYTTPAVEAYAIAQTDYTSDAWNILFDNLAGLIEIDPDYQGNLPLAAGLMLREAYYQRAALAEDAARSASPNSTEQVDAWEITRNSLVSLLLLDANPDITEPNLLTDIVAPYRDSQDRLRGVFYELASTALAADEWERAILATTDLLRLDPNDAIAQEQIRQAYYGAGSEALDNQDWDTARDALTILILLDAPSGESNPFAVDAPYLDARNLLLRAYHEDAATLLDADRWQDARAIANALRRLVPDDPTANEQIRAAFYDEGTTLLAEGQFTQAQRALFALLLEDASDSYTDLLAAIETPYRDSIDRFREAYYIPARAALDAGNWGLGRETALELLAISPGDINANDIVIDSYLRPAQQSFDAFSWAPARELLAELFAQDDAEQIALGTRYDEAVSLQARAYLEPAAATIARQDWASTREQAQTAIDLTVPLRTDAIATTIDPLLEEAADLLAQAYFEPIDLALAERDWESARDILLLLRTRISTTDPANRPYFPDDQTISSYLLNTYALPVNVALMSDDLGAANAALSALSVQFPEQEFVRNVLRVSLFDMPLSDALNRGDLSSAAELFDRLREEQVLTSELDEILLAFPQLRQALLDRNSSYWVRPGNPARTVTLALPDRIPSDLTALAVSSSGTRAVVGDSNGTLYVVDISRGETVLAIQTEAALISAAVIDPSGSWFATLQDDNRLQVWDARGGQPIAAPAPDEARLTALAVNSDGSRLAVGDSAGNVFVWDTTGWDAPLLQAQTGSSVGALAYAPASGRLAVASGTTVTVWNADLSTAELTATEAVPIRQVAFHPDESLFVTVGFSNVVTIRDSQGAALHLLDAHEDWVRTAAFTADGQILVTTSIDGRLILWDPEVGQPFNSANPGDLYALGFSLDADRMVAIGSAGTVNVWERP